MPRHQFISCTFGPPVVVPKQNTGGQGGTHITHPGIPSQHSKIQLLGASGYCPDGDATQQPGMSVGGWKLLFLSDFEQKGTAFSLTGGIQGNHHPTAVPRGSLTLILPYHPSGW